ncbi:hypothetical protein HHK36_030717 [Tetracentron sinense]|uniref:GRAM domain-containing protein n=1 Tax=Tetracentron sinense TaxID=13715 RepID=A0A834YD36_TETSI|nr:hypothetical protein HHK36_030717 [Tetracentron sinense]
MDHLQGDQSNTEKPKPSADYSPYPKLDPKDVALPASNQEENWDTLMMESQSHPDQTTNKLVSPAQKSVRWSSELTSDAPSENSATTMPLESNPYVSSAPEPSSSLSVKNTMDSVRDVLGRWGKKVGEAKKNAEDLAGNVWQHLKTGPSVADAAIGRIAQGTKILAEGGYEKIFRQTFETVPEEQLQKSYACYLSTSAGPVMGILYLSTAKLAFCSDNPLSYKVGDQTEWSYYKVFWSDVPYQTVVHRKVVVVIPLHQLKAVNPSASKANPAEKYIQVISVDDHEFWFMGFVNYDSAVKYLQEALQAHNLQCT